MLGLYVITPKKQLAFTGGLQDAWKNFSTRVIAKMSWVWNIRLYVTDTILWFLNLKLVSSEFLLFDRSAEREHY